MDEQDIEKRRVERARGQDAKRILDEPLIKEALEAMELSTMRAWSGTGPEESERREVLYHLLKGQELFEQIFRRHVETGSMAGTKLDEHEAQSLRERESE